MTGHEIANALDTAIEALTLARDRARQHGYQQFSEPDITRTPSGNVVVATGGGTAYIPAGGDRSREDTIKKSLNESIFRVSMWGGSSGTPCPQCGGTGRI